MGLIKRQPGERRWGLPIDYPFTDGDGAHVVLDRRSGIDRRQSPADLEDLLILFSQLPSVDPSQKQ
jgi:hypothetical protein